MLAAMCRSNTDVTIITGNSILESMYVCSYAVKADKHPMFNDTALTRLQKMGDGISDDRKLLASIARGATSVRTVGAQEAVVLDRQSTDLHVRKSFKRQNQLPPRMYWSSLSKTTRGKPIVCTNGRWIGWHKHPARLGY